jgi:glycosyltransferase involved in cell wall biosynthesis
MSERVPRVSVVVPVFNRGQYIREAIGSVLAQTWRDFEIIAVDDGSTDQSRTVLDSFGAAIRVIEHPNRANRGQSASINLGLRAARGDLIAILDSDDVWLPEKLAIQVGYLDAHPETGLVYGNGWAIDETGRRRYPIYGPEHRENSDANRVLLDCYFFLPTNSLVRAEVMRKAGFFDESLRAAQDHDMAIRIAEITRLAYVSESIFYYRRHSDSISVKSADRRWRNGFLILNKAAARHPYPASVVRKRRAVLHFRLGQCEAKSRHFVRALSHFLMAALLDPQRALAVLAGKQVVTSPN